MSDQEPMKVAFQLAISRAGGQSELSRKLAAFGVNLSQQMISHYLRGSGHCPAEMVLKVEALTGVSRHRLRPDVFGERDDGSAVA
ncbi:transcriptional regulator [Pseudomonas aeruginosa]|uniref:transcriptional regulator n=1 Tax=Pseudomonas aeruginosa TaxID=287 RepID=UPI0019170B57|nr:YdaS family helix-turn-helix protein [Pseudomonas aeruginosa]EKW4642247.1 helix-turn-helix domain-containing protein [Pseudomonas aeruginosa]MBH4232777.1 helix-turn-helix domain-containing protein [Pseudomonas aeruginosa]MDG3922791.1 helix-turn-helix domain-containing protein [Pseudomonas aeruginosa]MDG4011322.1 helix-turn-helix domain-containing protein [Pseudomonas aeruginosa]MDG4099223.1 helix-turn-helix domain-containing protein [Pseudomonas aeruginosa]